MHWAHAHTRTWHWLGSIIRPMTRRLALPFVAVAVLAASQFPSAQGRQGGAAAARPAVQTPLVDGTLAAPARRADEGLGLWLTVERATGQFVRYQRVPYQHWRITPDFPEFEFRWVKEASLARSAPRRCRLPRCKKTKDPPTLSAGAFALIYRA